MNKYIFILLVCTFQTQAQSPRNNHSFNPKKKSIELSTGITMSYVEAGAQNSQSVILLHGYTDTSRSFFPAIEELQKINPDLKIYALDQRGHGDSSMPNPETCAPQPELCFSPIHFAQDVIAFMDQQNISSGFIAGHSMGSIIAQEIALTYPTRVKGLILIGSGVNGTDNTIINDFLKGEIVDGIWKSALEKKVGEWPKDAYQLKPADLDPSLTNWIKSDWVADPTADPAFIQSIYPETMQVRLGTWIGSIRGLSKVDNRIRLRNLSVPTMVLWATQDTAFPENPDQEELKFALSAAAEKSKISYTYKVYGKQALPQSGMQENDLGHNLQWGAPKEVAADIASFIKSFKAADGTPYADPSNPLKVLNDYGKEKSGSVKK